MEESQFEAMVRLRLISHNLRLLNARKEKWSRLEEACEAFHISIRRYRRIENLHFAPTEDEMAKIAIILEKQIDWLFPPVLLDSVKRGVFSKRERILREPEIIFLTDKEMQRLEETKLLESGEDFFRIAQQRDLHSQVESVLDTLTPREQRVIRLRFGLDDGVSQTLEQVGVEFKVTRDRIRQIEAKALRKLRHPTRSRKLKDYLL